MSKDFMEEMEGNFKRNSNYLRELLENNKLELKFEHDSYLENLFKSDKERFINEFIESYELHLRILSEEELNKFKKGEKNISGTHFVCTECGEYFVYSLDINGIKPMKFKKTLGVSTELEYSHCVKIPKSYSFEIAFPTGELICDDGLPYTRELFKDIYDYDINCSKGIYDTIIDFSKNNILHVFVGNTSPSVWLKDDNKLAIGNSYEDNECICGADSYEDCTCEYKEIVPLDGEEISFICTDLWWASIVDVKVYKELLISQFGEKEALEKLKKMERAKKKIRPGIYNCTYFSEATDINYDNKPIIYAKMEWVRDI